MNKESLGEMICGMRILIDDFIGVILRSCIRKDLNIFIVISFFTGLISGNRLYCVFT